MEEIFTIEKAIQEVGDQFAKDLSPEEREEMEKAVFNHLSTGVSPLRILGFSTDLVNALYSVGQQLYRSQKYEEAANVFQAMARLDPINFRAYFGQAICAHKQRKYSIALLHYFTSLHFEKDDPLPLYHMAHCYYELKQKESAKEALRQAIALAEKDENKYGALSERASLWLKSLSSTKKKRSLTKG